jgi:hypothetical protein
MDEQLGVVVAAIRDNLSAFGRHPYRAVNRAAATAALCRDLSVEEAEARQLCRAAVEQHLGGYIESRISTGGMRGRLGPRRAFSESWWVNMAAIVEFA